MNHSILIVGGGNMGGAIAQALHAVPEFSVTVVETDAARRASLAVHGIPAFASFAESSAAEMVLLAIKPQQFAAAAAEMKTAFGARDPLLISIMAGIPLAQLAALSPRAVRVMPNLPATIRESMSVLCAPTLDAPSRQLAQTVFASIGEVAWVEDEAQLHAVTAISGSGPAYLFAFMEGLEEAALAHGLNAALAKKLVAQTMRGAALLAHASPEDVTTLRRQVTSKGGTTEAALQAFAAGDLPARIRSAVDAAAERSRALAGE